MQKRLIFTLLMLCVSFNLPAKTMHSLVGLQYELVGNWIQLSQQEAAAILQSGTVPESGRGVLLAVANGTTELFSMDGTQDFMMVIKDKLKAEYTKAMMAAKDQCTMLKKVNPNKADMLKSCKNHQKGKLKGIITTLSNSSTDFAELNLFLKDKMVTFMVPAELKQGKGTAFLQEIFQTIVLD